MEASEGLLVDYVLGQLGRDEARAIERRIAAEPEVAREVERLRAVLGLVAYAKAAEPPAHLRAAVLRAAAEARKARRARVRPAWSTFGLAAAALLAIVLGIDNYRVRQELRLERTVTAMLQEPNIVLSFALHGTGTGSGALGKVALDLDSGKGAVAIERLAALPAGQVYRLWALVGEKNVPCGDFGVNPEGRVVTQFPIPVDSYTAPIAKLFLTVEPTAAPPEPSGPDPATARLFGQQTRTQLPAPVTRDECAAAVRAFPAIARSPEARAAFVEGCTHAE